MRTATTANKAKLTFTTIADLPEIYAMSTLGDCMLPSVESGTKLVFSTSEEIRNGDLVSIHFKEGQQPEGTLRVQVKELVSLPPAWAIDNARRLPDFSPAGMFRQLNPRTIFAWEMSRIAAVHKCIGRLDPTGDRLQPIFERTFARQISRGCTL